MEWLENLWLVASAVGFAGELLKEVLGWLLGLAISAVVLWLLAHQELIGQSFFGRITFSYLGLEESGGASGAKSVKENAEEETEAEKGQIVEAKETSESSEEEDSDEAEKASREKTRMLPSIRCWTCSSAKYGSTIDCCGVG